MVSDVGVDQAHGGDVMTGTERDVDPASLSVEQARQVVAVVDVFLDRGFDVEGVDRETLEAVRVELQNYS
jgi:hypothetical protein